MLFISESLHNTAAAKQLEHIASDSASEDIEKVESDKIEKGGLSESVEQRE